MTTLICSPGITIGPTLYVVVESAGTATGGFVYLEPATGGATYGSLYMIY